MCFVVVLSVACCCVVFAFFLVCFVLVCYLRLHSLVKCVCLCVGCVVFWFYGLLF